MSKEICGVTKLPCCKCQPVCGSRKEDKDKPMSIGLITQIIYDIAVECAYNIDETTSNKLFDLIAMIDSRGVVLDKLD